MKLPLRCDNGYDDVIIRRHRTWCNMIHAYKLAKTI